MAKDAYYFSHDANARQDPKVLEMMSVYGAEGYGRYWIIVEMLREQSNHTLKLAGKYTFNALAMQLHCTADAAQQFVQDCIEEFELFESDDEVFWSNSLLRRMAMREEVSQKRKKAAEKRWGKKTDAEPSSDSENAKSMQMHTDDDANGMQGKERKGKETKGKEKKISNKEDDDEEESGNQKGESKSGPLYYTKEEMYVINQFTENIVMSSPFVSEQLVQWVRDFDGQYEIVTGAIKIAAGNGARRWTYVESILKDWAAKGVSSVEDAKAVQLERSKEKGSSQHAKKSKIDEIDQYV